MPDFMILAQVVLQIFCSHGCFYNAKCQSQKREIIHSNIHRIISKVNQVIYSLDTIHEPNSIILAQAVRQIFCLQGPLQASVAEQAGLSLTWSQTLEDRFYRDVGHMNIDLNKHKSFINQR